MDKHYNHQAAAKTLDTWTESMKNTDTSREYMHQAAFIDSRAEAIFTMVGALKAYDIPPVKKNSLTSARISDARAYPELVGYDSKHFATAMDKVKDLTYTLSTSFSMDKVEHWIPVPDSNVFGPSVNSSCRYFTVGADIPTRHLGECISHCLDNDVTYLCFKKEKHAIKNPGGFRVGDIVEMGFALVAFREPTRGEEDKQICKMILLQSSNTSLEAAFKARSAKDINLVPKGASITRLNTPITRKHFDFHDNSSDDEHYPEIRKCMVLLRVEDSLEGDKFPEEPRST
ncbi:hypothetical protein B0H17DRAFT_1277769 [Mycena rosella]|uniref:Uncharacterized protein n=1 Tax=Mycena rosella TaxID=1033263 RepID=A0AAD7C328_MYCRO|nr:hypothetical protein B0H17DRAFT_1277769 [Mycena rosella]